MAQNGHIWKEIHVPNISKPLFLVSVYIILLHPYFCEFYGSNMSKPHIRHKPSGMEFSPRPASLPIKRAILLPGMPGRNLSWWQGFLFNCILSKSNLPSSSGRHSGIWPRMPRHIIFAKADALQLTAFTFKIRSKGITPFMAPSDCTLRTMQ